MNTCNISDTKIIINSLQKHWVCVVPTDTVYGLMTLPWSLESIQRIFELKARPSNMNLQILVSWVEDIKKLGLKINETAQKILDSKYMPWAITLILWFDETRWRPDRLQDRYEAWIRIPNSDYLLNIIKNVWPILATSANHHGKPTPNNITEIVSQLFWKPDLIVDGGIIETTPSTIINCNFVEWWTIEREWIVSIKEIESYLNS
jgi:L-threonylcarbamoyladenylate synthase